MSYNSFNYNYRPAKSIERKLIIEILREIYGSSNKESCTYIGMGAIFFTDFRLIHKELGINKMINIESNVNDERRFIFNKPYACIELNWGMTNEVLPRLDWDNKTILWLDYTDSLQPYMFEDIDTFFSKAQIGSFFLLTCNSAFQKFFDKKNGIHDVDSFKEVFEEYSPYHLPPERLTAKKAPYLMKEMINSRIDHILKQRNASIEEAGDKCVYHQMLFIHYQDGAAMMTTGGYLTTANELRNFISTPVNSLPFIRSNNEISDIQSPILTNQETILLNTFLPCSKDILLDLEDVNINFIPVSEREKYIDNYRYYPNFFEVRDL